MQDAACLERARLADDKLFLYQQKTGTPVHCPLPPALVERLNAVRNDNDRFFFYDGTSQPQAWSRVGIESSKKSSRPQSPLSRVDIPIGSATLLRSRCY